MLTISTTRNVLNEWIIIFTNVKKMIADIQYKLIGNKINIHILKILGIT